MKIVVVTGGFDPVHSGHISLLNHADHLGDIVIVGLNSDAWLERKKGRAFMPWRERMTVLDNLHMVDNVLEFDDSDGSACELLRTVKRQYPYAEIIFANGGDRTKDNIPEMLVEGITFEFGIGGGNKANSSSWILEEWKAPKTPRPWGYYRVIHEVPGTKVKELTVDPGKSLSMQRHTDRAEHWLVTEGSCVVNFSDGEQERTIHQFQHIAVGQWHQLTNPFKEPCKIVEIQYGRRCIEEDIERR